ncbi:hypothetical protein JHK86_004379 [Glycine max]|nr:hypothetical protein JHK86_004379 [Glycine max]
MNSSRLSLHLVLKVIAVLNLKAIHSTREFVWWYNGHLDGQNLKPDLKNNGTVVILGQGNVALDIARNLLRPTTELASIDIASHALATLEESSIISTSGTYGGWMHAWPCDGWDERCLHAQWVSPMVVAKPTCL